MLRLPDLRSDVLLAVRAMRRHPWFSLMAVGSLALAIGLNATIFGLVDALLFRPLPGHRTGALMAVFTSESDGNGYGPCSYPAFHDLAARRDVFSNVGASAITPMLLTDVDHSQRLLGMMVSGSWFSTLGVQSAIGRVLQPSDDAGEGAPVVLSDGFWRRRFASDPAIVGRTLQMNGHTWQVVGVLPESFRGAFMTMTPDVYVPVAREAWATPGRNESGNRGGRSFLVHAQLASGVSLDDAKQQLHALASELGMRYPRSDSGRAFLITDERDSRPVPQAHSILVVFMSLLQVITGLVLLIACANLAGMLLARGADRRREIGVRLALGATRAQLVRMLVTESLLVGLLGGLGGLLLAYGGSSLLVRFQPPLPVPVSIDLQPDARVAIFSIALGLLAAVFFSLVPAWQSVSPVLTHALRDDSSLRRSRLRSLLMVTQVALSMLLLVGAGLFLRALQRAEGLRPGFEPDGVMAMTFDPSLSGLDEARANEFYRALLQDAQSLPGVESVALAEHVPLGLDWSEAGMWVPGGAFNPDGRSLDQPVNAVSEDYFETLRIPMLRGRALKTGQPVGEVVVNASFAKRFWPGAEAIGQKLSFEGPDGPWRTVVGVAADAAYRTIGETPRPFVYLALDHDGDDDATLLVRSRAPLATLGPALRSRVRALAPSLASVTPQPLEQLMGASLLPGRLAGGVLAVTGLLALLLACIGLHAVVAFAVSRRTREIGVRIALGAVPRDILRLVIGEGTKLLVWGLSIGAALAVTAGFALRGLLYGLSPLDLPAYGLVIVLLSASALLACWLPARRAAEVDPMIALRQD